jgi:hypothetical protein
VNNDKSREKSVVEIDRLQHYRRRFESHHEAWRFEVGMLDSAEKMEDEMMEFCINEAVLEVTVSMCKGFLTSVLSDLLRARIVLRQSYCFGYFREEDAPDVPQHIFEDRQHQLEAAVRQVSSLLEKTDSGKGNVYDKSLADEKNVYEKSSEQIVKQYKPGYSQRGEKSVGEDGVIPASKLGTANWEDVNELVQKFKEIQRGQHALRQWIDTVQMIADEY